MNNKDFSLLSSMKSTGELRETYSRFSLEREVADFLGISYNSLLSFSLKQKENMRAWLKQPSRLNLRWLHYQNSEELNARLREEYYQLGAVSFREKYSLGGSLSRVTRYLGLQRGQPYYRDPYLRDGYSLLVKKNPLEHDCSFKYWFLGYFLGDGNMMRNSRRVSITSTDEQVIRLLWECFGLDFETHRGVRREGTSLPIYSFHTSDLRVRTILEFFRFQPNKSNVGWFGWEMIPSKYRGDFLRGLYESDGSYHICAKTSSWRLTWLGHESYIKPISEYINGSFHPKGSLFYTEVSSRKTRKVISEMYREDSTLGTVDQPSNLRKARKALEVLHESRCEI